MPRTCCSLTLLFSLLVFVCLLVFGLDQFLGRPLRLQMSRRAAQVKKAETPPRAVKFPRNYHTTGRLHLPHSGIVEPFEAWYAGDYNRSRIDYYYGTDKTFQRGDLGEYGTTFKVVPMYTDKKGNYIGCWHLAGRKERPIIPQPVVPPDMPDRFKFQKHEVYHGTSANKWEFRYLAFDMLNTQTMWVSTLDPVRPVRYEMKGYDSLLASYYDYYVLEYISFEEWKPDLKRFELPKDQSCYNYSHTLESHLVANPMQEFMSFGAWNESAVEHIFREYKHHHDKTYASRDEHVSRKHIFRHNMRYIRSVNRQNLTYKLSPNHMVDMTEAEYDTHKGSSKENSSTAHQGGVHLDEHHEKYSNASTILKTVELPDELDWRDYGAVTAVRGQGICGSCYAIAATGAVEGAHFMKTGKLVELSAQQVVDCSWGSGNHGCRGGYYNKALSWIYLNGVATAESYGQYLAQEGTCHFEGARLGARINAFAFVPKYNNSALKRAVAKFGPACVTINTNPRSFKFYSWGIYDDPACDNSSTWHTVLVVGYGKENGVPYWLIKNSWSTSWGLDGYVKLAWKKNTCGVTKNPVVALIDHTTFRFPMKEKVTFMNPNIPDSMGRKIHAKHRPRSRARYAASKKRAKMREERLRIKEGNDSRVTASLGNSSDASNSLKSSVKFSNRSSKMRETTVTEKRPRLDERNGLLVEKKKLAHAAERLRNKTANEAAEPFEEKIITNQLKSDGEQSLQEDSDISTSEHSSIHANVGQQIAGIGKTSSELNSTEKLASTKSEAQSLSSKTRFSPKRPLPKHPGGYDRKSKNITMAARNKQENARGAKKGHRSKKSRARKKPEKRVVKPHFSGKLQDIFEKLENVISGGVERRKELFNKKFGK